MGDAGGFISQWRLCPELRLNAYRQSREFSSPVTCLHVHKELRCFVAGSEQGLMIVYGLVRGEEVGRIQAQDPVREVVLTSSPLATIVALTSTRQLLSYSVNGQLLKVID
jgi:hypothetical protein